MDETSAKYLKQAASGDEDSWKKLVEIYEPYIRGIAAFCDVRNYEDIKDIAQDTLLVMFKQLPSFKRERTGSLRSWLKTVTTRIAGDLKRVKEHRHIHVDLAGVSELQSLDEARFDRLVLSMKIHDVVTSIFAIVKSDFSERDVRIFEERIFKKRKATDVAEEFGVRSSLVHTVCSRVMKRLRDVASDLYGADPFGESN